MSKMPRTDSDETITPSPASEHPHTSPSDAERGEVVPASAQAANEKTPQDGPLKRRTTGATADGVEKAQDPRTREWENDIVTWDGPDDPANPMNWPKHKKIRTTLLMGATTMSSTFSSSIFSSASEYISRDFHISTEVATLGLSLFVLG